MSSQGFRGYICSRMVERSVPQHIQQMVIRDYCERNGFNFLLSATEYCMPGSTMILDAVLQERIEGVVFYSLFQMPTDAGKRKKIYASGKQIHFAAENLRITNDNERERIEDIFLLRSIHAGNELPSAFA